MPDDRVHGRVAQRWPGPSRAECTRDPVRHLPIPEHPTSLLRSTGGSPAKVSRTRTGLAPNRDARLRAKEGMTSAPLSGTRSTWRSCARPRSSGCARLRPPPAELLGVAPVFDDERNAGRPVYFCDVIVRDDAPVQTFSDLRGKRVGLQRQELPERLLRPPGQAGRSGKDENFFGSVTCSGSHLNSIEAVLRGQADAAAIDSNVLRIQLRETPGPPQQSCASSNPGAPTRYNQS